ncbi:MAG: DUF5011 domain-containing protein [Erysipelotrichaceae bacterium]
MIFMFKFCVALFICFFGLFMQEIYATTKEEMPYEISSIKSNETGFELSGWGMIANNQHFLNDQTHSYRIILNSNKEQLIFPATIQVQDQSELMKILGVRKCNTNEFNQISDTCWYDYKNVGFKSLIPYHMLKMDTEYSVSLEITAKSTGSVKTIILYYPTEVPITHIDRVYEYRAISSLEDTSLMVSYYDVFVRVKPGIKNSWYRTNNACSVSHGNKLYFKDRSHFNQIYERRIVNGTTHYRLAGNEAGCERKHRIIQEGTVISPAWIASSFVEYNGKPLTIKTFLNNKPPVLKIHQNPIITLDHVDTFNPFDFVSAYDKEEGDLTSKINKLSGQIIKNIGTYELIFEVRDKYGLSDTKKMIVTVKENPNTPPWIEAFDKTVYQYVPFDYLKDIKGEDKEDGNINHRLTYSGKVDIKKIGEYILTYHVKDSKNLQTDKTIKIIVIKNPREKIRYIDKHRPWYKEMLPINWKDKYERLLDQLQQERSIITEDIDS